MSDCHFAVCIIYRHHERSHLSCGVLGAAWRSVFALISAASRTSSSAHSYSTSLSEAHTCLHLGTLSSTCQAQPQPLLVCFVAPLSLRCRCGRHAHIAGCGMGSRHGICPGRTHTSMRASGAASRRPARVIASAGEGGGARPRAAHEQLVGGGQGGCVLPSRTEGGRGMRGRGTTREPPPAGVGGAIAVQAACRSVGVTAVWGAGRGEQRTKNIFSMVATLEVSQLRGWLKAVAPCRGSQAGHTVRGRLRAGWSEAAGDRARLARSVQGESARDCKLAGRAR